MVLPPDGQPGHCDYPNCDNWPGAGTQGDLLLFERVGFDLFFRCVSLLFGYFLFLFLFSGITTATWHNMADEM